MNFKQFIEKANAILESRGDDLRKKHRLKPGEASARLSRRADIKRFDYERNTPKRDALDWLSARSGDRASGVTPEDRSTSPDGKSRVVKRGGGKRTTISAGENRDRGDKEERFAKWASGERSSPNMSDVDRKLRHGR
jgi:hypothetical protein